MSATSAASPDFVISRVFDAPRDLVWTCFTLVALTFEDAGTSKTRLTVVSSPLNPTDEERRTFDAGHRSMSQGWGGTLDKLAAYLAKANE